MSDLEALWRAVLANPDEDTPRLAYADCVQESGDEERAELIRVQCGLERLPPCLFGEPGEPRCDQTARPYSISCAACEGRRRSAELLAGNRERWEPVCVACGGLKLISGGQFYTDGEVVEDDKITCTTCTGTGRQPCRWERGFPVVTVAQMRQVWEFLEHTIGRIGPAQGLDRPSPGEWEPTPWLRALLRTHHVAGVVPGDVVPFFHQARPAVTSNLSVPPAVLARCSGFYTSPELATAALGRAVVLAALEWLDARGAT